MQDAGPTQHGANARDEFAWAEGFGDVVVGADSETEDCIEFGITSGEHDDVGVGESPQLPAHLNAVERGQAEVKDHDVRWASMRGGDCGGSIERDFDIKAAALEVVGDDSGEIRFVLNDDRTQTKLRPRLVHRCWRGLGNNRIHASHLGRKVPQESIRCSDLEQILTLTIRNPLVVTRRVEDGQTHIAG